MALEDTYLFHILRFIRDGRARTVYDLVELLDGVRRQMAARKRGLAGPTTVREMEQVLAGLAELGVLPLPGDDGGPPDREPPSRPRDGGGDGGDDGGAGGPVGPESGQGGEGLSEVLEHPVLFCLSDDAQEARIDAAFGVQAPEGDRE